MSLLAILNVPILKDRFFGGDKGDISQFTNKELISSVDYLSSSGRYAMWDYMIDKFYVGNEMFGCGLGSMKEFMRANEDSGDTEHFAMLHNDLLHILIETGIVGIILFFLFWVRVVRDSVRDMFDASNPYFLRVFAFAALAVSIAILFSMIFENILSSLFTYGITFVFIGVYYKYKSLAGG